MTAPQQPQSGIPWWQNPAVIGPIVAALLGANGLQLYNGSDKVTKADASAAATEVARIWERQYDTAREDLRQCRETVRELRQRLASNASFEYFSAGEMQEEEE